MLGLSVADEKELHPEGSSFGLYPASMPVCSIAHKIFCDAKTESRVREGNKKKVELARFYTMGRGFAK